MTDMREAVISLIENIPGNGNHDGLHLARANAEIVANTIMPEIDRRVAEERAKLLERLREPSEGMEAAGRAGLPWDVDSDYAPIVWQAMLAQFEKENNNDDCNTL